MSKTKVLHRVDGNEVLCGWTVFENTDGIIVAFLDSGYQVPRELLLGEVAVLAARVRDLEAEESGEPDWTCVSCGNSDPDKFKGIVYPSTPSSAEEYDMECAECGSMEIEESPLCALISSIEKRELLEIRHSRELQRARLEAKIEATTPTNCWCGPSMECSRCKMRKGWISELAALDAEDGK